MSRLRLPILALAPLVVFAACSSESSVDAAPYVEAVQADLEADDGGFALEGESAACVAEALVDAADADRLDEAGVTPDDFAEAESFDDVDADFDEDELRDDLENSLASCSLGAPLTEVFVADFPFELSQDDTGCVVDSLDDGATLSAGLASALVDGDDSGIQDAFSTALADCPSVTGNLLAESISAAGVPVSDEARDCLTAEMGERGAEGVEQLIAGGAVAQTLGEEIGLACLSDLDG
ncbi:hypothetical protein [Actinospongicola halichondriae]|uniref:hypothetical protein n=1 Tax=Actinospongicola halichondriae TaxID=3236844 RepID=UPI003D4AFAFC